jgi:hypothetical protein
LELILAKPYSQEIVSQALAAEQKGLSPRMSG